MEWSPGRGMCRRVQRRNLWGRWASRSASAAEEFCAHGGELTPLSRRFHKYSDVFPRESARLFSYDPSIHGGKEDATEEPISPQAQVCRTRGPAEDRAEVYVTVS